MEHGVFGKKIPAVLHVVLEPVYDLAAVLIHILNMVETTVQANI